MIKLKRIYDSPAKDDGFRVLVDRLWPRGVSKEGAAVDLWMKEVAPSNELRRTFHHDLDRWPEFCRRYAQELEELPEAVAMLNEKSRGGTLTLLYAAKDTEHNNAAALKAFLEQRTKEPRSERP